MNEIYNECRINTESLTNTLMESKIQINNLMLFHCKHSHYIKTECSIIFHNQEKNALLSLSHRSWYPRHSYTAIINFIGIFKDIGSDCFQF